MGSVVREITRPAADITRELTPTFITDMLPRALGGTPDRQREEAEAASARQRATVTTQSTNESRRLAQSTSDLERKKALMSRGGSGRSLLIKTSPTGVSPATGTNLGGTA